MLRPMRKEWIENLPADLPVKLAYTIDLTAAPNSQVSHVERF